MKSLSSRRRWVTAAKYAIDKLPVDNDFLKNLSWISPYNQTSCLKQATREEEKTEFMDYCTAELPPENAATNESDFYGHKVGQVKNVTGQIHCGLLSKLAKAVATSNSPFPPVYAHTLTIFAHFIFFPVHLESSVYLDALSYL